MQEARLAKEKMHGRLACGRPLVVRLASEKSSPDFCSPNGTAGEAGSSQMSRGARIAAIKNKLKALENEEEEGGSSSKKQRKS